MLKAIIVCLAVLSLSSSQIIPSVTFDCPDAYGYYFTNGFDLWGGDVSDAEFDTYAQAVADAKNYINGDNTKAATLVSLEGGRYHVYRKIAAKANPSLATNYTRINAFYGKKVAERNSLLIQVKERSTSALKTSTCGAATS